MHNLVCNFSSLFWYVFGEFLSKK